MKLKFLGIFLLILVAGCTQKVIEETPEEPALNLTTAEAPGKESISLPEPLAEFPIRNIVFKCLDGTIVKAMEECAGKSGETVQPNEEYVPEDAVDIASIIPNPDQVWNSLPKKLKDSLKDKSNLRFGFNYSFDKTFTASYVAAGIQTNVSIKAMKSSDESQKLISNGLTKCIPLSKPVALSSVLAGVNCDSKVKDVLGDFAGAGLYRPSSSDPYSKILYFTRENFYVEIAEFNSKELTDLSFMKALARIVLGNLDNSKNFGKQKIYIRNSFRPYLDTDVPYEIKMENSREIDKILDRITELNRKLQITPVRPAYLPCSERPPIYSELESLLKQLEVYASKGSQLENFIGKERNFVEQIKYQTKGDCREY